VPDRRAPTCGTWRRRLTLSLLVGASIGAQPLAAPARATSLAHATGFEAAGIKPVGLVLNGVADDRPTLAAELDGDLVVLRDDLKLLGLLLPADDRLLAIEGQMFVRLSDVPGLAARWSDDGASLLLSASPAAFATTLRSGGAAARSLPLSPIRPLAYLGYDLSLSRDAGGLKASGLFDLGASGAWGVIGTTALLAPGSHRPVRLDTAFQRDFPGQRLRLLIGDTLTRGSEFGNAVRFGGLRLGTDFALTPSEISFPLPVVSGSVLVPSVVELLAANGQQSHTVGPGRFLIEAPATITGAGEVMLTINDASGAVRRIRQSFYSSSSLLRPGLDDLSLELGALRKNYARRSFSYGKGFAAVGWRRGLTPGLTAATRIEASRSTAMAGLGFDAVVGRLGEVALAGALSRTATGVGSQWRTQFQRLGRRGSFRASYLKSSADFTQVGSPLSPDRQGRQEIGVSANLNLRLGEIGAGVIDARLKDGSQYRLANITFSATIRNVYLQASLRLSRTSERRESGLFLSLSRPLGRRSSMAFTADAGRLTTAFQATALGGQGLSAGLAATRGARANDINAYALAATPVGELEVTAFRSKQFTALRGSARGALVFIGDRLIPTVRLYDGLALVEVASQQNVRILHEGRPVWRKARGGRPVLLTGLQPYAANRIGIRSEDVPFEMSIDRDEEVAVPGFRQAAVVRFGETMPSPARTVALVDELARPLTPGLDVFAGSVRIGTTGYDGLVFLASGITGKTVRVDTAAGPCEALLPNESRYDLNGEPLRCQLVRLAEAIK
jgi:outer membrane usher protein